MVSGSCVWVKTDEDGLFVNKAAPGGDLDIYYIPKEIMIVNPYAKGLGEGPYKRDGNCVLMLNDTYSQGIMPLLEKYVSLLVESDVSQNIAIIMSRATMILSAADEKTKQSADCRMISTSFLYPNNLTLSSRPKLSISLSRFSFSSPSPQIE